MRRVFVPALLAVACVVFSSADASAFGLFDKLCNKGCDSCCDVEPACGCEAPVASCGCAEPSCGADLACDSGCGIRKPGLLSRLFAKHHACDVGCGCEVIEPACGCEVAAPTCGCEVAEPACGCEAPCAPVCRPACGSKVKGFLKGLFHKHNACCDVAPSCGCEVAPACGCGSPEPNCGCGW